MADKNVECQRYSTQCRRIHDNLRSIFCIIMEFNCEQGRVHRCRNGAVDEKYHGADSRKRAGHEGIGGIYEHEAE